MGLPRSNVGNIVTNGMQILSVGATTASAVLGRADKVLNPISAEQKQAAYEADMQYKEARTSKLRTETEAASAAAEQKAKLSEARLKGQELLNERRQQMIDKNKPDTDKVYSTVDEIMEDNSEQVPELKKKINSDITYIMNRSVKAQKRSVIAEKRRDVRKDKEE